jgi:RNA polymerase sigma-70 factor (ECF subfamily)
MTDNDIIQQVVNGDKEVFRLLVQRYQSMVFRITVGFVHNKEDADDLTQEIFIQVYHALSKFRGEANFQTWLYRIVLNAALNHTRKNKRNIFQRLGNLFHQDWEKEKYLRIPETENPENILIEEEHRELVRKALDTLPENQRSAIILSKYDDLSQREIAEILGTTEGAVEALLQRAKSNLRKK